MLYFKILFIYRYFFLDFGVLWWWREGGFGVSPWQIEQMHTLLLSTHGQPRRYTGQLSKYVVTSDNAECPLLGLPGSWKPNPDPSIFCCLWSWGPVSLPVVYFWQASCGLGHLGCKASFFRISHAFKNPSKPLLRLCTLALRNCFWLGLIWWILLNLIFSYNSLLKW